MSDYKSLQNIAYDHLRAMISNGELEYDLVYSETKLAKQLNISRTPVRDALNRLARERYIDILPNRGFTLHLPNAADIHEVYHIRYMIETYCAAYIIANRDTQAAQDILLKMRDALERQKALIAEQSIPDLRLFWEADEVFHYALLEFLNISAFNIQYDSFMHICMPQYLKPEYVEGRTHSTIVEHEAILNALSEGNIEQVRKMIRLHLDTTLQLRLPEEDRNRQIQIVEPF